jgi:hypothetical protein
VGAADSIAGGHYILDLRATSAALHAGIASIYDLVAIAVL